jgi:hypothetical protein
MLTSTLKLEMSLVFSKKSGASEERGVLTYLIIIDQLLWYHLLHRSIFCLLRIYHLISSTRSIYLSVLMLAMYPQTHFYLLFTRMYQYSTIFTIIDVKLKFAKKEKKRRIVRYVPSIHTRVSTAHRCYLERAQ